MKRYVILAGILLAATAVQAQTRTKTKGESNLYGRFGAGYGFTHAGQTNILSGTNGAFNFNGSTNTVSGAAGSMTTQSLKRGSFGTGMSISAAAGYMLNRNVGIELGVCAIVAPTTYKFTDNSVGSGATYATTLTTKAKLPVYIIPALLLTTAHTGLNVYSRTGVALPVSDKLSITTSSNDLSAGSPSLSTGDYVLYQRFSVGLQGALGISYPLSKGISIWAEASGIFRNAYTKKLELTTAIQNGVNVTSMLSTNEKVTEYEFDASSPGANTNPNTSSKDLTSSVPFSSIGVNVGLRFAIMP